MDEIIDKSLNGWVDGWMNEWMNEWRGPAEPGGVRQNAGTMAESLASSVCVGPGATAGPG